LSPWREIHAVALSVTSWLVMRSGSRLAPMLLSKLSKKRSSSIPLPPK